jgi:hypothetical protein
MARPDKSLEDLLREMEGPMPAADHRGDGRVPPALPPAPGGGFAGRFLLPLLLVGMGFGAGWMAAGWRSTLA